MPIYCYGNDEVGTVERYYDSGCAPRFIRIGKMRLWRNYGAESVGVPATAGWPIECFASGVQPDQSGELREVFRKQGVPTEVTADGNPIYRDAQHRKRALAARGLHDKSSYN